MPETIGKKKSLYLSLGTIAGAATIVGVTVTVMQVLRNEQTTLQATIKNLQAQLEKCGGQESSVSCEELKQELSDKNRQLKECQKKCLEPIPSPPTPADERPNCEDIEPNESEDSAIRCKKEVTGTVGFEGDPEDWVRFVVPANGRLSFTVKNLSKKGARGAWLGLLKKKNKGGRIWTAKGPKIGNSIKPAESIRCDPWTVSKGAVFYLIVVPYQPHHKVSYHMEIHFQEM